MMFEYYVPRGVLDDDNTTVNRTSMISHLHRTNTLNRDAVINQVVTPVELLHRTLYSMTRRS